jgi:hypothetical protein
VALRLRKLVLILEETLIFYLNPDTFKYGNGSVEMLTLKTVH